MTYSRYAVYYLPTDANLAKFGATWLGWDVERGQAVSQFDVHGLPEATQTPARYGFHATLKPPFRLAEVREMDQLLAECGRLGAHLAPIRFEGLELAAIGNFLALVPTKNSDDVARLAEACVRQLDGFRAPLSERELFRRREVGLSKRQDKLLEQWGYPFVMEEFRFHLTLTGSLPAEAVDHWAEIARRFLGDTPKPFVIDTIALCGERSDGRFEQITRYPLGGKVKKIA